MRVRTASIDDIDGMSQVLQRLVAANKRTSPSDVEFVRDNYVSNPNGIRCSVAEDADNSILGFQSLIRAVEGNPFGVQSGWGIVGTHVSPNAFRRGVGKGLWKSSHEAAIAEGIRKIDARIDPANAVAIAYYEAIGFVAYETASGEVSHSFTLSP